MQPPYLLLALLMGGVSRPLDARTIHFPTDNGPQEQKYLWKHRSRCFVLEGWGKPVRNVDGHDQWAIWRFDVTGATQAIVSAHVLNSFAFSASPDGDHFTEIGREEGTGGSNEGIKRFDVTPFLGPRFLYLKLEHGAPTKWNGGFGACLFSLTLEITDDRDRAYARIAPTPRPPALDGRLEEPVWQQAAPLRTCSDRFMQRAPILSTTFRLAYDADHFYIAAECEQPGADRLSPAAIAHDSAVYGEDCVEVFLQPPGSEPYYHLAVGPTGATFDERRGEGANTWESNARVGVHRTDQQWSVEVALPVAAMEAPFLAPGQQWRFGLYRVALQHAQYVAWSCVEGGGWHSPSRFGTVELVEEAGRPLPLVNILPLRQPTLGENEALLEVGGVAEPERYYLTLDVLPLRSNRLPDDQQDLDQMNPSSVEGALPENTGEVGGSVVPVKYLLDRFGAAHLVASLWEKDRGTLLSRAVYSLTLARQEVQPLEVTLRQPFVSTEETLPAEVRLHLTPERREGAQVTAALVDPQGRRSQEQRQPAQETLRFTFDVRSLAMGQYTVRFEVFDRTGTSLAVVEKPLTKFSPEGQPKVVTFDANQVCYVDGKPVMPRGFMLGEPVKDLLEAGYNCALWGGETLEGRSGLDQAERNGVLGILHLCNYLRGKNDFEAIRAVVSRRKNEPGLFAWYLADEPEAYGDTPEILRQAYSIIKDIDPNHPVLVLTNAPGMLAHYQGAADVILADPYPIPSYPLKMVADWTDAAVQAAAGKQAVWMTPQGFGWGDLGASTDRPPTPDEFTNMLYTCFIHGAKGILWWPYSVPRQKYWDHFTKMGRQCGIFEPFILFGQPAAGMVEGVQVQGEVHWRAWEHEGKVLVLAVNLSREPRPLTVPVPQGVERVQALAGEQEAVVQEGTLRETLPPAGSRAYLFVKP